MVNAGILVKPKLKDKITKKNIIEFQEILKKLPQLDIQTSHKFLDGMYCREVFMPKGSIVISKTHKLENLTIISKGKCIEVTEEYEKRTIEAPCTFISPKNIKRALYILEDMVWTTVHYNPDNIKCLEKLEEKIIKPDDCLIESEVKKCLGLV